MANNDIQAVLQAILQQQAGLANQAPPEVQQGLLEPGQTGYADIFRNPSRSQQAGLGTILGTIAGADPNIDLSRRVAAALGSGVLATQGMRQAEASEEERRRKQQFDQLSTLRDTASELSKRLEAQQKQALDQQRFGLEQDKFGLDRARLDMDILSKSTLYEDTVGQDDLGNPITATFSYNPVTGAKTQLSGGVSGTTQQQRGEAREAASKAMTTIKEGNRLIFDQDLDQIFGPLEMRPTIGGLTSGAVGGKAKQLKGSYDRFVQDRVLDVARVLAPVTDLDVEQLKATLAPQTTLGSAAEARKWYTENFIPKVLTKIRYNVSPSQALSVGSSMITDGIAAGMTGPETVGLLGELPTVGELKGRIPANSFTRRDSNHPLYGHVIPLSVIKAMAKADGVTPKDFITRMNLKLIVEE